MNLRIRIMRGLLNPTADHPISPHEITTNPNTAVRLQAHKIMGGVVVD